MKSPDEVLKSGSGPAVIYEFAGLRLDPARRRLERAGRVIPLAARAFDALTLLVEGDGAPVSKETLLSRLWPRVTVEENSVARLVSDLRRDLGESAACVVTAPRQGYRLGAVVRRQGPPAAPHPRPGGRTLAILPFSSPSGDEADRQLGFGLADALISRLSRLSSLVVRPTSSVARFADTPDSPVTVGRALDAEAVLCGAVRRSGDQVRVTVQLVDVASAAAIWAAKFDEQADDLFALEDALSARAADALEVELTRGEQTSLARRPTADREAYDLYVHGRMWLSRRVADSLQLAADCFRQATERDPGFALAHAGLAEAYTVVAIASATLDPQPPHRMAPLARAAAERALAIDDGLSEAHGILGHIAFCYDWDWPRAEDAYLRALEIDPVNASTRQYLAMALSSLGRHDEAVEQMRLAVQFDPLNMVRSANLGFILYRARRFQQAVDQLEDAVAMDANAYARFRLGLALEAVGRTRDALAQYDAMLALPRGDLHALVGKGHLLARLGRRDEARDILARLQGMARERYVSAYYLAEIHAGLGDVDRALGQLEAACEERSVLMISLRTNPKFDPLRGQERFHAVERRVGLCG